MKYLKRIPDDQLKLRIEAFGAVQIKGPKWYDKTTTAKLQAKKCDKNALFLQFKTDIFHACKF